MEKKTNKYIAVAYQLYTTENGKATLVEEAPADKPFQFISGFSIALEDFEKKMLELATGDTFEFTLTKEQAYGDHEAERVLDLDKQMFCINGKFDDKNVYVDAILPLQNEEGMRFLGKVLDISDTQVTIDLNHPLAGKDLTFKGSIVESREATNEEIEKMINRMSGGCGCGGDCGGGCGGGGCDGGCGGGCH